MRRSVLTLVALAVAGFVSAQPGNGYYDKVDGLSKTALKLALKSIISNHKQLDYSSGLPAAYRQVYYNDSNSTYVYDMFSYDQYTYSSSKWNREHVIPNSWWGGVRNKAYSDVFSVIPAEATANNRKSNYPIGEVNNVTWTNDCIKVGNPVSGQGGSYNYVFEPADEYKGDFARIYFYVATCYSDIEWGSRSTVTSEIEREDWPTLHSWLYQLLLKWHNADPVSEKEIEINNAAESVQGNRNPFIDYPILADYIWGRDTLETFNLTSATLYSHTTDTVADPDTTVVEPDRPDTTLVDGSIILADYFNGITEGNDAKTNGSSTAWNGDSCFVTVSHAYQAGGAVRLGSSKQSGSISSVPIASSGNETFVVELDVKGWTTVEGHLIISLGNESQTVQYTSTLSDSYETVRLTFTNVEPNSTLTISTSTKRCFIDNIKVVVQTSREENPVEDVNKDRKVDTQDVLAIYDGMRTGDINGLDVNGDGNVDTQDVLSVYEYIRGK